MKECVGLGFSSCAVKREVALNLLVQSNYTDGKTKSQQCVGGEPSQLETVPR